MTVLILSADNATGRAGPRELAELQRRTRSGRSSVVRAAGGLERRLGWIEREGQRTEAGDLAPSIYSIRYEQLLGVAAEHGLARAAHGLVVAEPSSFNFGASNEKEKQQEVGPTVGPTPEPRRPSEGRSDLLPPDLPREAAPRAHAREGFAKAILGALRGALSPLASELFAERLVDEITPARSLALVLQGLRELEAAAGDVALFGKPWTPPQLALAARRWIRGARAERAPEDDRPWGAARMTPDNESPAPPVDHRELAAGAKRVLAAIAA